MLIGVFILNTTYLLHSQEITINNVLPRLDTNGNIIDAHDGRLIQFGDVFYWYGTSYGTTNGFTAKNHYVCYSSKDLKTWTKEGKLLPDQPEGVYYRPHVVYNEKTKRYILWYNWYPKLWNGQFGVATSKSPSGPFKIKNNDVKMFRSDIGLGDFGLFVDDDKTCYLSYNTIQNHQVSIEKLNDDYTGSTMENGGIIAEHMEAGTQFKRNGNYYLLTDHTCCFCNYGSGAKVYISDNPLNGYTLTTNINRYPGKPTFLLNNTIDRGTTYETLRKRHQKFDAVEIQFAGETVLDELTLHQFTGNRPENCGDVSNPRVHPEILTPGFLIYKWSYDTWEKISIVNTTVKRTALRQDITVSFVQTRTSQIKIVPVAESYHYEELYLNGIELLHNKQKMALNDMRFYITGEDITQKPIIPAQQSYVTKLQTEDGERFIWIGDLWGSASDNIKGYDYQYWSDPLEFNEDGTIKPLQWKDSWSIELKK
ncbi:family 43 glycosylhydrolase [Costertonia aggregata]|uniref:Family 43 glycosylhydrolase n=1 Tax=Costertonia aggregata TaxID=343403 RepID=A0A7H9AMH6_9FLAO|nr:family 43 glycosylhydrolase [Costertonia aggregata]QLG44649.1 family 43 glycosylhydrolase [Costertonia aggregata]